MMPPAVASGRLAAYLILCRDATVRGETTLLSEQIGRRSGLNATQVRRDLMPFKGIGRRGVGYSVDRLTAALEQGLAGTRGGGSGGAVLIAAAALDPTLSGDGLIARIVRDGAAKARLLDQLTRPGISVHGDVVLS